MCTSFLNILIYREHFEDFVVRHFISRAHDIMVACNAYMEGAKMRCLVKGAVQEGGESCSGQSKTSLARNMKVAALNFTGTGAVYSGGSNGLSDL